LSVEHLEDRRLLTVTSSFDETTAILTVSSDADDNITIAAASGLAKVNGTSVIIGTDFLAASSVQRIEVTGGSSTQTIDLSAVTASSFTAMLGTTVALNGAATVSAHVIGSAFDDLITSNDQGNVLEGFDGDDILIAGAGDDTLIAGTGSTRFVFTDSAVGNVTIVGTQPDPESDDGNVLDFSQLSPNATTAAGIQLDLSDTNIQEVGPNGLHLTLATDDFVTMVLGTLGDDWIKGGGANASTAFVGGPGDDTLTGGAGGSDSFIFADWNEMPGWDGAGASHVTINETSSNNNVLFFGDASLLDPKLAWLVPYSASVSLDLRDDMDGEEQWITSSSLALTINGVGNFSTVFGSGQHANVIYASDLDSMIVGGHDTNYLVGGEGTNLLVANPAAIGVGEFGIDGDSTLIAGSGDDTLIGGTGNDTLIGGSGNVQLIANLSLVGAPEGTIDGNNTLIGGTGNAVMFAGNGDDVLELGTGSENALFIGTGTARFVFQRPETESLVYIIGSITSQMNTLDFSDYGTGVHVNLNAPGFYDPDHLRIWDVDPLTEEIVPLGANIHKVIGSTIGDNLLVAYGGEEPLEMSSRLLSQETKGESLATMEWELANPFDISNYQVNIDPNFSGSFLRPRGGNELTASTPNRGVMSSSIQLSLNEIDPNDILVAGSGNDTLIAGTGDDILVAGAGDNLLIGGSGDTTYVFNGENGNATLIAGQAQNWLDFSQSVAAVTLCLSSADVQSWGGGTIALDDPDSFQNVIGSSYDDFLCGNEANNYFFGGDGNDTLIGDGGDNFLVGGIGDNTLAAGNGSNILVSGIDSSNLYGGTGSNLLVAGELTWADLSALPTATERDAVIDAVMSTWADDAPLAERIANVTGAANATNPLPTALQFIPGVTLFKGDGQNILTPSVGENLVYLNTTVDIALVADPTNTTFAEIDPSVTVLTAEFADGVLTVSYRGTGDVTYSIDDGFLLVNGEQPLETPLAIEDVTQVVTQLGPLAGQYNRDFLFANMPNLDATAWSRAKPLSAIGATEVYVNTFLTSQVGPDWEDFTDIVAEDIADAINVGDYTLLWEAVCDGRTNTGGQLQSAAWHDIADSRFALGLAILSESSNMRSMSAASASGGEGGTIDMEDTEVNEGGVASFTFKFNAEYFDGFSVEWNTQDGSAIGGYGTRDYQISSGKVEKLDGWEGDGGFAVQTYDNYIVNNDTYFYGQLSNLQNDVGFDSNNDHHEGHMSIRDGSGKATIHNTSILPKASVWSRVVTEGEGLHIPVTLDREYGLPVTVNWTTENATAKAGEDFQGTSGTVTFNPRTTTITTVTHGETTKYIDIPTINDAIPEYQEYFIVRITVGSNCEIAPLGDHGTENIADNDPDPILTVADVTVVEGSAATFTLSLSTQSEKPISVFYYTANATASDPGDYTRLTTTQLSFAPGETSKTVQVSTIDDSIPEPTQYFWFNVTTGSNVRFPDNLGGISVKGNITDNDPLHAQVVSVSFGNPTGIPAGKGNIPIVRDPVAGQQALTYSGTHYLDQNHNGAQDASDHQYPIAYVRDSIPKLTVVVWAERNEFVQSFSIKGAGDWNITLNPTIASKIDSGEGNGSILLEAAIESSLAIPDEVNYKDLLVVNWDVKAGDDTSWRSAGASRNQAYATLKAPAIGAVWHTLIDIGSRKAIGTSGTGVAAEDTTISKIWPAFTSRNVQRVDGTPLTYYEDYRCNNTTTQSLLAYGDGQCGAWAKLFLDVLKVQGIDRVDDYVLVSPTTAGEGFIVNDWDFSNTPSGTGTYQWENEVAGNPLADWNVLFAAPDFDSYAWLAGADVTDEPGEGGQNNDDPASLFGNHQFVKLTVNGVTQFYDPSYGETYASLLDFDDNHLAGYFTILTYNSGTNVTTFGFRKNIIGTLEVFRNPAVTNY
jgi:Ca2+-binding RTX toxin-like protein